MLETPNNEMYRCFTQDHRRCPRKLVFQAEDAVLFVGSGTTGAVAKIVAALSLDKKSHSWNLYKTNR